MMSERPIPNSIDNMISLLKASCDNSCPPLKPMAKSRYMEMNFDILAGISKSLFTYTAMIPRTKNNNAGFVKFSISKLRSICAFITFCF